MTIETVDEIIPNRIEVPYEPNAKQCRFHEAGEDEVVYGGAKGGGKSCALVIEAAAYGSEYPGAEVYLFRETYDDLEANLINEWKSKIPSHCYSYNESKHLATMYNGTRVFFRYIRNEKDAEGYQGRSIDFIGVDELTKHTEKSIQELLSCVRSPKGYPARFRATCNPGGIGHGWVKRRYIDPTNRGERSYVDSITENAIKFIPATVYDNHVLMANDPGYVKRLENLSPARKKAFLNGDWDIVEGQAFDEWRNSPNEDHTWTHVIKPFEIPSGWPRWRSLDWGYAKPYAVYWFTMDWDGVIYTYRESYGMEPEQFNVGIKWTPEQVGEEVKRLEKGDRISTGVADPSIWAKIDGKPSIAQQFVSAGVNWTRATNDRLNGKMEIHNRLRFDEEGKPKVYVFSNCVHLIRTLPELPMDQARPEDVDSDGEDHAYDSWRYGLMFKPLKPKLKPIDKGGFYTPTERKEQGFDKYEIRRAK